MLHSKRLECLPLRVPSPFHVLLLFQISMSRKNPNTRKFATIWKKPFPNWRAIRECVELRLPAPAQACLLSRQQRLRVVCARFSLSLIFLTRSACFPVYTLLPCFHLHDIKLLILLKPSLIFKAHQAVCS